MKKSQQLRKLIKEQLRVIVAENLYENHNILKSEVLDSIERIIDKNHNILKSEVLDSIERIIDKKSYLRNKPTSSSKPYPSSFPKLKNIDGETDWRDTGEMGE